MMVINYYYFTEEQFHAMPLLVVEKEVFVEEKDTLVLNEPYNNNKEVGITSVNNNNNTSDEIVFETVVSINDNIILENLTIKLVDYDSTSSDNESLSSIQETKKMLLEKHTNSNISYFSEQASSRDSDFQFEDDQIKNIVFDLDEFLNKLFVSRK
ncbi:hypothetical protein FQA39_LY15172 [Lamprigera yunnana]|nr:hypothetical protein FQA39_LY15172 [Lamprigera yunnana]